MAMAMGDTGDRGWVDAEVGDVGWEVDSESDSELISGSESVMKVTYPSFSLVLQTSYGFRAYGHPNRHLFESESIFII
jgi:hypothetical protein